LNSALENSYDPMYASYSESLNSTRKNSSNPGKIFSSFMRKFTNGMTNSTYDRMNRTSTYCCSSASVPTREINHWVRRILKAYFAGRKRFE
jgi:hypothetical protein